MEMTSAQSHSAESRVIAQHTQVVWPRFLAFIGDNLIASVLVGMVSNVFGTESGIVHSGPNFHFQSISYFPWGSTALGTVVELGVFFLYFTVQEALLGTTLCKALCRVYVVRTNGQPINVWAAIVRNLFLPIDLFLFIGALLIRFSFWHQRIGDRVAGTIVVGSESIATPFFTRRGARLRMIALGLIAVLFLGGTTAFNYFGRPPLEVQTLYQTQAAPFDSCVTHYTLGTPTRTLDSITYPVTYQINGGSVPSQTEVILLHWNGLLAGWQFQSGMGTNCPAAS